MEDAEQQNTEQKFSIDYVKVYSPSTVLGVFSNALKTSVEGKLILLKAEYRSVSSAKEYGGYFYENLFSTNENKSIQVKLNPKLRAELQDKHIYIFKGYIEKKVGKSVIDILFVADEIAMKEEKQISETDLKKYQVIQKKIEKGFKDLEAAIKEHIYNDTTFKILNIYGLTGIVHKDFEVGIAEAKNRFTILEQRVNMTSKSDIIRLLKNLSSNQNQYDAIALVRGGGGAAELEIFNDPDIGDEVLKLKPLFITAVGHAVNETLVDKIADKKFHLPLDFGNKLKTWVDEANEEMSNSKSVLIKQVKNDFAKTYEQALKTKDQSIDSLNKEKEKLFEQLNAATSKSNQVIIWVIIALIAGIVAGVFIGKL